MSDRGATSPDAAPFAPVVRARTVYSWAASIVVLNLILLFVGDEPRQITQYLLASTMLWLCALPLLAFLLKPGFNLPFLPVVSALHFVVYGLPVFLSGRFEIRHVGVRDGAITHALLLACAGWASMLIAFYGVPLGGRRLAKSIASRGLSTHFSVVGMQNRLLVATFAFLALRLGLLYFTPPEGLIQLFRLLGDLPLITTAGILLMYLRRQCGAIHFVPAVFAVVVMALVDLGSGLIYTAARDLVIFFFIYVAERRRTPWLALVLGVALIAPFMATKADFRRLTWGRNNQLAPLDKVELFIKLTSDAYVSGRSGLSDVQESASSRFDSTSMFGYVVELTPQRVPFWNGDTYEYALWSFVPRLLVPEKPKQGLGQEFGHRYGFLDDSDDETSVNLLQSVEMYANFGDTGVVVGSLLLGFLYRVVVAFSSRSVSDDGTQLIAAHVFEGLLNIEANLTLVFGGIVYTVLCNVVMLKLLHWGKPKAGTS